MKKQTYTFLELLQDFKVLIPIIQRDYAHGRDNAKAKDVREGLIDSLWNVVNPKNVDNQKSDKGLHLDFVYGRIHGACLIPFDGQQRLTTLFLFHRYLYEKEKGEKWKGSHEQALLKKFSYATRPSARDFCEALCENSIFGEENTKIPPCINDISDAQWFDVSWLDDPTVKSMLRVLHTIHEKAPAAEKLDLGGLNRITFTLADMGQLNMGDMSYISMNSTGRPLTAWENFKASYLQFLHTKGKEANHQEKEEATKTDRKINTIWTDFFFEQSSKNGVTNTGSYDHLMMEMVQLYLYNHQKFICDNEGHILEEKLEIPYPGSKHDKYIPFSSYKNVLEKHKLNPLFNFWDYLHNNKNKNEALRSWEPIWFRAKEKYKTRVWEAGKFSHKERVAFHACIRLFEHGDIDYETLGEWMRIIWNILENSQVDSVDTYKTYIKLVDELHDKIFKEKVAQIDSKEELWQRISDLTHSGFSAAAKEQLAEEITKCRWLTHEACTPGQLHTWESHPLLKGRIRYICQDNLDSYWDETPTKFYYLNCFYNNVCATQGLNRAKNLVILLLTLYNKPVHMDGLTFPAAQADTEWKKLITESEQWKCLKRDILSSEFISLLNKQPESLLSNDAQDYIKSLSIIYPDILQDKFILWFKDNESYARRYKGQWRTTCKKLDTYSELQYLCDGAVDVRNSEEQYCVNRTVNGAYKISIAKETANEGTPRIICFDCFKKLEGDTFIEKLESLFKQPVDTQTGDAATAPQ